MCVNPVIEHFASTLPAAPLVIYRAKKIVTMERANPEATAVAVSGKQILLAGSLEEIKQFLGDKPYLVDDTFAAKVIMPGFIDQHLHPLLGALTLAVEVIAPEDWVVPGRIWKKATNQQQFLGRLKDANAGLVDPNEWLFTWGYHQYFHGPLERKTLDSISATRPIAVWHRSCHEFYLIIWTPPSARGYFLAPSTPTAVRSPQGIMVESWSFDGCAWVYLDTLCRAGSA